MAEAFSRVFSLPGLLVAVVVVLAAFEIWSWFTRSRPTVNTILATLAAVIATWSYGAQDAGLRLQREQHEVALAEMRGVLLFQAEHDRDWNVTLQKADGRPFQVEQLALIPTFQASLDEGPVDGAPVDVQPAYSSRDGNRIAEIPDALDRICLVDNTLCADQNRVIMLTLEFFHNGSRYRIVANPTD